MVASVSVCLYIKGASPGFKRGRRPDDKSELVLQGLTGVAMQKKKKGALGEQSGSGSSKLTDPKESIEDTLSGDGSSAGSQARKARPWNDTLLTSNPNLDLKTSHFGLQACDDHAPLPQELKARRGVLSVHVLVADVGYILPDPNRERDKTDDGE